jgi:hypothetical protein
MRVFKSPAKVEKGNDPSIFLAGSIDNGRAYNWQEDVIAHFSEAAVDLYNPRRDEWDAGILADPADPDFCEQVQWELDAMKQADYIIMNLLATSQSPVSLFELGLYANSNKLLVCCPDAFWRSGNVKLVCSYYHIPCFEKIETLLNTLKGIK